MFEAIMSAKQCSSVATVPVMTEVSDADTMIACCSSNHAISMPTQYSLTSQLFSTLLDTLTAHSLPHQLALLAALSTELLSTIAS
jgi:hypothetical protein